MPCKDYKSLNPGGGGGGGILIFFFNKARKQHETGLALLFKLYFINLTWPSAAKLVTIFSTLNSIAIDTKTKQDNLFNWIIIFRFCMTQMYMKVHIKML